MPIQFRCQHCRQILSISSKKAGQEVNCPNCREATRVPTMEDVQAAIAAARERRAAEKQAPVRESVTAGGSSPPADEGSELWDQANQERNPWLDDEVDEEPDPGINKLQFNEGGLDMTPMVDVTFLLLIFFMITASFNIQKSMPTDPPEPEDEGAAQTMTIQDQEQEDLLVGISANDELSLDDEPISGLSALVDALNAKAGGGGELSMTIEADPRCTFGIMVGVMDAGISAGMQRIKRVARPSDE
ncbi:MAG: biopolymer transporter ExbD [Planctomycetaceae bacterium]